MGISHILIPPSILHLSTRSLNVRVADVGDGLKVVQWLLLGSAVKEDPALEPVRESDAELVAGKLADGNSKDPVEFFEGALLGLGDPEEDHDKGDGVETSVQSKGAHGLETVEDEGEGGSKDGGPEETCGDGEAHARLAMGQGEDLGGVGEGHRTLTGGVEGAEHEDEEAHQGGSEGACVGGDEGAETGGEESPCHLGEGEEEETSSTELGVVSCERFLADVQLTVSIVQKAGKAKSQLTRPKPKEPSMAWNSVMSASLKTVVE